MKAIRFHEFGGPEVLKYEDVPDPRPRKDQVLVRVKAVALNHLDLFIRNGLPGVKLPHINGSDVAGIVAEAGEYITDIKVGQRVLLAPHTFCGVCPACTRGEQNFCPQYSVLGYLNDGGNAEFIAVPRVNVLPIQGELTYDEAAAVPLVSLTAWHMLVGRCHIKPGDTVLVLGGGSGIGSMAIQICKMFGATCIATAGDENKLDQCRELGADHVINHYQQKISEEVAGEHEVAQARREDCDLRRHHRPGGGLRHPLPLRAPAFVPGLVHGHAGRVPRGDEAHFLRQAEAGGR